MVILVYHIQSYSPAHLLLREREFIYQVDMQLLKFFLCLYLYMYILYMYMVYTVYNIHVIFTALYHCVYDSPLTFSTQLNEN